MRDKRHLPIQIALILSAIVLLLFLRPNYEIMSKVLVISVILIVLLIGLLSVFFVVAQFTKSLRQPVWLTLMPSAVLVYMGCLTISLSKYKELIEQMQSQWDIRTVALGLAVVGFGWGLFMQTRPRPQDKISGLGEETGKLVGRMQGVSGKLSDLERETDALIAQSDKLDALQGEVSSLSTAIESVKNKLKDLGETASVLLDESYRLGNKLTSKGSKQNKVD